MQAIGEHTPLQHHPIVQGLVVLLHLFIAPPLICLCCSLLSFFKFFIWNKF
jgi:hypothetical protein